MAIAVVTQPRGAIPPFAPQLARAIVVEAGPAGITVENGGSPEAFLRVSGRGEELTTQTSLFANQLQSLVQTAAARVDQAGSADGPSGDTLTFSQVNMTGKINVLQSATLTVGVDRASLGNGRVDSVQVHLLADYTPVPKDATATVLIRSMGFVVYRAELDETGRLDATFDLERQTMNQYVNLEFALTYSPHEACGPLTAPISFQVDPRSTLTVHRGGTPLDGFGAVPSEFSPKFLVAFDGTDSNQLGFAARVVAAIARLTGRQLTPQVVDPKIAADASTGALIVASSATISKTALNPPLSGDGNAVDVNLPTALRANINDGLGSVQAFADSPRNRSVVLVTTTAAWTLVEPLFSWIDGLKGGWAALTGDVLAAGAAGIPSDIAVGAAADASAGPPSLHPMNPWIPRAAWAALIAIVGVIATVWWFSRRRGKIVTGAPDDEPTTTPEPVD